MLATARTLLDRHFGYSDFRPLQQQVLIPALAGRDVLAILPTGGGKSICFQIPALIDPGLTVVVSPLISLMEDQVAGLTRRGIGAASLGGAIDRDRMVELLEQARSGQLRLLYVSPERLPRVAGLLVELGVAVGRLAVDEAHCIAEWGHDFRPSYRGILDARRVLGGPPVIALTGSATVAVREQIRRSLGFGRDAAMVVGSFDRANLRLEVRNVLSREDRLAKIVVLVRTAPGSAVVYAPTRGTVEGLCRVLIDAGVAAAPYHAGMAPDDRSAVLTGFLEDRHRVVVATCAFGMGIDKPGVRLVAHWTMPSTPESYYQEAGRAGRDGNQALCVLYHHPGDQHLPMQQVAATFPDEKMIEKIWADPSLRRRQPAAVVEAADRLAAELRPDRGAVDWRGVRRRRREAHDRIRAMVAYASGPSCRRATLLGWFGERIGSCAGCDRCQRHRRTPPLSNWRRWIAR